VETNNDAFCKELARASSVIIVPGYGMAVAKCQGEVGQLAKILTASGK